MKRSSHFTINISLGLPALLVRWIVFTFDIRFLHSSYKWPTQLSLPVFITFRTSASAYTSCTAFLFFKLLPTFTGPKILPVGSFFTKMGKFFSSITFTQVPSLGSIYKFREDPQVFYWVYLGWPRKEPTLSCTLANQNSTC